MDIHRVIAQNVRYFRKLRGMSQEKLAEESQVDRTYISKIETGSRNTTAETIAKVAAALGTVPHVLLVEDYPKHKVGQMEIDLNGLAESVDANPSLLSFVIGYQAEYMARREIARQLGIAEFKKYDDHDRKHHGDIWFVYEGREYSVEVKSLQSNSCKLDERSGEWCGKYQCDGSDASDVELGNGHVVHTVALPFGLFDIVCVALFPFGGTWRFAFARCGDLDPMRHRANSKIPEEDCPCFIKTMQDISLPLKPPYTAQIVELL